MEMRCELSCEQDHKPVSGFIDRLDPTPIVDPIVQIDVDCDDFLYKPLDYMQSRTGLRKSRVEIFSVLTMEIFNATQN